MKNKKAQIMLSFNKENEKLSPMKSVLMLLEQLVHIICNHNLFTDPCIDGISNILLASYLLDKKDIDIINLISNSNSSYLKNNHFEFMYRQIIKKQYSNLDLRLIQNISYILKSCNTYGIIISKFQYLNLTEQIFQYIFKIESIINNCTEYNKNDSYNPYLACYGINLIYIHMKNKKYKLAYQLCIDLLTYIVQNKTFICEEAFNVYCNIIEIYYIKEDYSNLFDYLRSNYELLRTKIGFHNMTVFTLFNLIKCRPCK